VLGESTLIALMRQPAAIGHATATAAAVTYGPKVYNPNHTTGMLRKVTKPVPFMNERAVSQSVWACLQGEIMTMESGLLAPLAAGSTPPTGCDACCDQPKVAAFAAVAAQIAATRTNNLAQIAATLGLARVGVELHFGGGNSAYYLLHNANAVQQQPMAVAVAQAQPPVEQVQVTVPPGTAPGSIMQIVTPTGASAQVQVPPGVAPGQAFIVNIGGGAVGLNPNPTIVT
jgi:hypothetical protein